jgi:hypothetical protein
MKNTLKYNDRVVMHSTTSIDLDGKTGTLIGIAVALASNNFWIVELDEPHPDRRAIVLIDSCIKHLDEYKVWICPKCGVDRLKEACSKGQVTSDCPMVGTT